MWSLYEFFFLVSKSNKRYKDTPRKKSCEKFNRNESKLKIELKINFYCQKERKITFLDVLMIEINSGWCFLTACNKRIDENFWFEWMREPMQREKNFIFFVFLFFLKGYYAVFLMNEDDWLVMQLKVTAREEEDF